MSAFAKIWAIMPLTTQDYMAEDSGQAGALEIEVTPAMIAAGVDFFVEWDSEFYSGPFTSPSSFVSALFRIMAFKSANPCEISASPLNRNST
jgi:hypothetical protein